MSGLEVAVGVAGIVPAFTSAVSLYRSLKEKKKSARNTNLETSLTIGGPQVQAEYDGDFTRLGLGLRLGMVCLKQPEYKHSKD